MSETCLTVRYTITGMIYDENKRAIGMTGEQVLVYTDRDGHSFSQTMMVKFAEGSYAEGLRENPKYPYEMPAQPEKFKIVRKQNPDSPYPIWTTHSERGICIHQAGRSEGCILVDTREPKGKYIYDNLMDRIYKLAEPLMGEILAVLDKRTAEEIKQFPVYYENNPQYIKELKA